jgi:hypothetical protein
MPFTAFGNSFAASSDSPFGEADGSLCWPAGASAVAVRDTDASPFSFCIYVFALLMGGLDVVAPLRAAVAARTPA